MKTNKKKQPKFITSRGADPECFLFNKETGEIVSAIDVLKYDKHNPIILGDDVGLYFDNCMAEFTVKPAFSRSDFVTSIKSALTKINNYIVKNCGPQYKLTVQASHEFNPKYLEHPEALKIGCNPEYNADEIREIIPPNFSGVLRSAGGHIAVGRNDYQDYEDQDGEPLMDFDSKLNLVKLLDYYVGVPFTLIDNDPTSLRRRQIYGSPSSHRPKPFGIEYRVLSCYWISSPKLVELIYDLSELAINQLLANKHEEIFNKIDKKLVNAAIKENNKELSEEILSVIDIPKNLQVRLNQLKNVKSWDLYKEWGLKNSIKSNEVNVAANSVIN